MSGKYNVKKKKKISTVSPLFAWMRKSILAGIVIGGCIYFFAILCKNYEIHFSDSVGMADIIKQVSLKNLYFYLLKKRCYMFILFFCLAFLFNIKYAVLISGTIFGMYYGIVMCSSILHENLMGILHAISYFYPHFLFYFLIILIVGGMMNQKDTSCGCSTNHLRSVRIKYFLKIFVIILLLLLGVYLELKCPILFEKIFTNM